MAYGEWRELQARKAQYGFECNFDSYIIENITILTNALGQPSRAKPNSWWFETNVSNGVAKLKVYTNDPLLRDQFLDAISVGV